MCESADRHKLLIDSSEGYNDKMHFYFCFVMWFDIISLHERNERTNNGMNVMELLMLLCLQQVKSRPSASLPASLPHPNIYVTFCKRTIQRAASLPAQVRYCECLKSSQTLFFFRSTKRLQFSPFKPSGCVSCVDAQRSCKPFYLRAACH